MGHALEVSWKSIYVLFKDSSSPLNISRGVAPPFLSLEYRISRIGCRMYRPGTTMHTLTSRMKIHQAKTSALYLRTTTTPGGTDS